MNQKDFIRKYDAKEEFSEEELIQIAYEDADGIEIEEKIYDEKLRWVIPVTIYFKCEGRWFGMEYYEGLTERQENEYSCQPFEVERVERVTTVIDWIYKGKE